MDENTNNNKQKDLKEYKNILNEEMNECKVVLSNASLNNKIKSEFQINEIKSNLRKCKSDITGNRMLYLCGNINTTMCPHDVNESSDMPFPMNIKFVKKYKYKIYEYKNVSKYYILWLKLLNIKYLLSKNFKNIFKIFAMLFVTIFIIYASIYNFNKAKNTLIFYILCIIYIFINNMYYYYFKKKQLFKKFKEFINKYQYSKYIFGVQLFVYILLLILYIILGMNKTKLHFLSLSGFFIILIMLVLLSKRIKDINIKIVTSALFFQIFVCYITLRFSYGTNVIKYITNYINQLIYYSTYGANLIFNFNKTNVDKTLFMKVLKKSFFFNNIRFFHR